MNCKTRNELLNLKCQIEGTMVEVEDEGNQPYIYHKGEWLKYLKELPMSGSTFPTFDDLIKVEGKEGMTAFVEYDETTYIFLQGRWGAFSSPTHSSITVPSWSPEELDRRRNVIIKHYDDMDIYEVKNGEIVATFNRILGKTGYESLSIKKTSNECVVEVHTPLLDIRRDISIDIMYDFLVKSTF